MEGLELRLRELWSYWLIWEADIYMYLFMMYICIYLYIFNGHVVIEHIYEVQCNKRHHIASL